MTILGNTPCELLGGYPDRKSGDEVRKLGVFTLLGGLENCLPAVPKSRLSRLIFDKIMKLRSLATYVLDHRVHLCFTYLLTVVVVDVIDVYCQSGHLPQVVRKLKALCSYQFI